MATIFTKIIQGEIPSYKIAETDDFIAFLDIRPLALGHTLVVPKVEVDYIFDHDDETLQKLILFSKNVALAMDKVIDCERIGLSIIGLEVPHTHVHLIPLRQIGDMNFSNPRPNFTAEQMEDIRAKIANKFQGLNRWNYEDFLALILIYTANASDGISPKEFDFIENHAGKSHFRKAIQFFNDNSEVETIEKIDELADEFGRENHDVIFKDIQAMIQVDKRDQEIEEQIARMLKRII